MRTVALLAVAILIAVTADAQTLRCPASGCQYDSIFVDRRSLRELTLEWSRAGWTVEPLTANTVTLTRESTYAPPGDCYPYDTPPRVPTTDAIRLSVVIEAREGRYRATLSESSVKYVTGQRRASMYRVTADASVIPLARFFHGEVTRRGLIRNAAWVRCFGAQLTDWLQPAPTGGGGDW